MRTSKGFGLLELMIALVVLALLIALAIPTYSQFVERARVAKAIGDIAVMSLEIEKFRLANDSIPPLTLAEIVIAVPLDPWERPYAYLNIMAAGAGFGGLRKDGALVPLNTDFDLYSLGKDGASVGPITAAPSRDDIIRANNGAYIGKAENY